MANPRVVRGRCPRRSITRFHSSADGQFATLDYSAGKDLGNESYCLLVVELALWSLGQSSIGFIRT